MNTLTMLWICASIAAAVFGVMIYSIGTFRRSSGAEATQVRSNFAELLWTAVAIIIVISAVAPAVKQTVLIQDEETRTLLVAEHTGQPKFGP